MHCNARIPTAYYCTVTSACSHRNNYSSVPNVCIEPRGVNEHTLFPERILYRWPCESVRVHNGGEKNETKKRVRTTYRKIFFLFFFQRCPAQPSSPEFDLCVSRRVMSRPPPPRCDSDERAANYYMAYTPSLIRISIKLHPVLALEWQKNNIVQLNRTLLRDARKKPLAVWNIGKKKLLWYIGRLLTVL